MGMYNYQNDIFDTFAIPNGVDKNLLIQNLMVQTAELELLYTDPDVLKTVIGIWSAKELPIWEKLKATTEYDYNPIWNTDREITHTDSKRHATTATVKLLAVNSPSGVMHRNYTVQRWMLAIIPPFRDDFIINPLGKSLDTHLLRLCRKPVPVHLRIFSLIHELSINNEQQKETPKAMFPVAKIMFIR